MKKRMLKKRMMHRAFVYFLSMSFSLLTSGFPTGGIQAKEIRSPVGEMVSKGEVKFEARENVWKGVDLHHFPIFQGTKIKTEKGLAITNFSNNSQIRIGPFSLFSFDEANRFTLSQGNIDFRISHGSTVNFKIGSLSVMNSPVLEAAKGSSISYPRREETIGSILVHSNGSATVKSTQGNLSIIGRDHIVLAALSSKNSITIPSAVVRGVSKEMVAQVGNIPEEDPPAGSPEGTPGGKAGWFSKLRSIWIPGAIGTGVLSLAVWGATSDGEDDGTPLPICR